MDRPQEGRPTGPAAAPEARNDGEWHRRLAAALNSTNDVGAARALSRHDRRGVGWPRFWRATCGS
jgi:hypothetical protein